MTSDVPPEEMALLATGADYWSTHEVPELGLPRIRVSDGPHGLRVQDDDNPDHLGLGRSLPATCFPPAVTLASSWDPQLIRIVGAALAREARSLGVDVVLGPGIEIKRSPLCGRNFEYYSEDPLLTGRLAGAMVQGLQSQGVAACVKHFACNTQETDRLRVSADVDARALREIYLRAFELTIRDGNPWAVMSAYNRINGVFASENPWLLTDVLREEWGYDGVVISDWGAVHDPVAAVAAGLDLRMPGRPSDSRVRDPLSNGTLDEAVVDRVAERLRLLASRTDESRKTRPIIDFDAHHQIARRAAAESAVLLHDDRTLLPIDLAAVGSMAVIGELARAPRYQGAGSSAVNPTRVVSALDAFQTRLGQTTAVSFAPGYVLQPDQDATGLVDEAVALAQSNELVVLFLGLPPSYEAEGRDRTTIELPADQVALVKAVAAVNPHVIVALSNGSAVSTADWRDTVGSIVEFGLLVRPMATASSMCCWETSTRPASCPKPCLCGSKIHRRTWISLATWATSDTARASTLATAGSMPATWRLTILSATDCPTPRSATPTCTSACTTSTIRPLSPCRLPSPTRAVETVARSFRSTSVIAAGSCRCLSEN
jgi:beta-glucosidase